MSTVFIFRFSKQVSYEKEGSEQYRKIRANNPWSTHMPYLMHTTGWFDKKLREREVATVHGECMSQDFTEATLH